MAQPTDLDVCSGQVEQPTILTAFIIIMLVWIFPICPLA